MESHHLRTLDGRAHVVFWSGCAGKYSKLASDAHVKQGVHVGGRAFRTVEEALAEDASEERELAALRSKFGRSRELQGILAATGSALLLALDNELAAPSRRGGRVAAGVIVGHNRSGALLMQVRRELSM